MIEYLTNDQVLHCPVPPTTLSGENMLACACLVKEAKDAYRACRRTPEFWMKVPWSDAQVMVCFTHINAREVHLRA